MPGSKSPLIVRTYGCVFQSEVDNEQSIQQGAENSVESEIFLNIKFKSIERKNYYLFCKDNSFS